MVATVNFVFSDNESTLIRLKKDIEPGEGFEEIEKLIDAIKRNVKQNPSLSDADGKLKYAISVFEVHGYTATFEAPFEIDFRANYSSDK